MATVVGAAGWARSSGAVKASNKASAMRQQSVDTGITLNQHSMIFETLYAGAPAGAPQGKP
jgi:hypothetical protein